LQELWESFVAQAQAYGPKAIVAALILLGFIAVAYIARWIIAAAINRTSLAKKANAVPGRETRTLGASLGAAAFWVIILVGIVQALTQLELTEVTDPLNRMLGEIFGYLPQIVGAILIFLVFLILASVASQTARAVLTFVDPLPQRFKLASGPVNISGVASVIIGVIIIVVGAIAALEALRIYSISEPATEMLREIASVLPNLVAAIVILAIFGAFAQLIASMLRRVLPSSGLDAMVARIGLLKGGDDKLTHRTLSPRLRVSSSCCWVSSRRCRPSIFKSSPKCWALCWTSRRGLHSARSSSSPACSLRALFPRQ
jgi:hypothetical protein